VYTAQDQIIIQATPSQVFQVLSDLHRLPEWYVPAESIILLGEGPLEPGRQFRLTVRTLGGIPLQALGTVLTYQPEAGTLIWRGQSLGISGDSCWQALPQNGQTSLKHTFAGSGWMLLLSKLLGRNIMTVRARLANLKNLVETEIRA
jgi:hypothetical protein